MPKRLTLYIATVALLLCAVPADAAWMAYNDNLRQAGDFTATNVAGWTIHNNDRTHFTGRLVDFATGSGAGMPTVTFTMGGTGLSVSGGGAGGNPAPGTDAYDVFNGIVDFGPDTVYYGNTGWWVEIEFTGLDPANTYSFVGTAIRSNNYPNRISLFTILDAVAFGNQTLDVSFGREPDGAPNWVTLAAGEYLILTKDAVQLASAYSVPADVQVLAWGAGSLANDGKKIQLSKPGDEDHDERHWIRVDRVVYSDGAHPAGTDPWPVEADGQGASLTRLDPTTYGNDPANWEAAAPSPGLASGRFGRHIETGLRDAGSPLESVTSGSTARAGT